MKTVQEHIAATVATFRALSKGRQSVIRRKADEYIAAKPWMADASTFWRGLSARQVSALI